MIKAVIFDMDGVLIDAKEWHYESLNLALELFGYQITRHDHISTYDGLPTRRKLQMLSEQTGLPVLLHEFINSLKQKYTIQIVNQKCVPVFAHQYALSTLKRDGLRLAVASNSVRHSVETMMLKSSLMSFLDFFLSNEDVVRGKPDPEIYKLAIKKLNLAPSECVIVEDNPHGIEAARASNAHVLEVSSVDDVNYWNIKKFIAGVEAKD